MSEASSVPPAPVSTSFATTNLQHSHPIWARAAGRAGGQMDFDGGSVKGGRGRGKGKQGGSTKTSKHMAGTQPDDENDGRRYERLSLLSLELQQNAMPDGAEASVVASDEDDASSEHGMYENGSKQKLRIDNDDYDDYDDEDDEDDDGSVLHDDGDAYKQGRDAILEKAVAAVGGRKHSKRKLNSVDEDDCVSRGSTCSSKKARNAYEQTFPVKGIHCVGCALASRISPVERFIDDNIGKMAELSLWKMAALCWKREVVDPAKREGVAVVDWTWRDIATHFKLHTTNPTINRTAMLHTLTALRMNVENKIIRIDGEQREVDKTSAELCLKILAAESRERQLLQAERSGVGKGSSSGRKVASASQFDDV
jgi:hypothetical protein